MVARDAEAYICVYAYIYIYIHALAYTHTHMHTYNVFSLAACLPIPQLMFARSVGLTYVQL